jgi:ParB family chromosome partitioning protein
MKQPTLMQIDRVRVDQIDARDRLRPVSEAGVDSLLASIAEVGVMKDPIHVRRKKDGRLVLIAGGHRLEAARRLGWEEIEARVWTDVTDDWARMMEIDDNLAGAEMNALDTAVFLATRKAVYERLHPEAKVGGDRRSVEFQTDTMSVWSFAKATAEKWGIDERHVRRMVAAGSRLNPKEVGQLRRAPRPVTLKDLDTIGRIESAVERYRVVDLLSNGQVKSASEARNRIRAEEKGEAVEGVVEEGKDPAFNALMTAWKRAGAAARKRFLLEMRQEVWEAQNKGVPLNRWAEADSPVDDAGEAA